MCSFPKGLGALGMWGLGRVLGGQARSPLPCVCSQTAPQARMGEAGHKWVGDRAFAPRGSSVREPEKSIRNAAPSLSVIVIACS